MNDDEVLAMLKKLNSLPSHEKRAYIEFLTGDEREKQRGLAEKALEFERLDRAGKLKDFYAQSSDCKSLADLLREIDMPLDKARRILGRSGAV